MVDIQKRAGRDRLFYNQYRWSINFTTPGAYYIRSLDEKKSRELIRWHREHPGIHGIYHHATPQQEQNLMRLLAWLQSNRHRMRIMTCWSDVSLFTNDLELLGEIEMLSQDQFSFIRYLRFSEAIVDQPEGTLLRRNSPFRYRSYLRERCNTDQQKAAMRDWLGAQDTCTYKINPSLRFMLDSATWLWTRNSYFVDYSDPRFGTMLRMVMPVRKTLDIRNQ